MGLELFCLVNILGLRKPAAGNNTLAFLYVLGFSPDCVLFWLRTVSVWAFQHRVFRSKLPGLLVHRDAIIQGRISHSVQSQHERFSGTYET